MRCAWRCWAAVNTLCLPRPGLDKNTYLLPHFPPHEPSTALQVAAPQQEAATLHTYKLQSARAFTGTGRRQKDIPCPWRAWPGRGETVLHPCLGCLGCDVVVVVCRYCMCRRRCRVSLEMRLQRADDVARLVPSWRPLSPLTCLAWSFTRWLRVTKAID